MYFVLCCVGNKLYLILSLHLLLAHFYADDSQLYVAFSPQEPGDEESIARKVSACLKDIRRWMLANMLKKNDEKNRVHHCMSTAN